MPPHPNAAPAEPLDASEPSALEDPADAQELPELETTQEIAPPPAVDMTGAFDFVRRLAGELSEGDVRLPSYPEIADRVRRVLDDERASAARVAQVVGSDPALAARVIRIANSATFNPGATPVTDLQAAVGRVGHELVRSVAVSFAISQIRLASKNPEVNAQLQELWRKSTLVAACAYVLARDTKLANPDQALVTGLLHNVGRLYIVTRANLRVETYSQSGQWDEVLHDWHPQIGRSILEHWKFPETIVEAIGEQNSWDRSRGRSGGLHDVLVCSIALVPCVWYREMLDDTIGAVPAFQRLGLDATRCRQFLTDTALQIKQLRDALAGG